MNARFRLNSIYAVISLSIFIYLFVSIRIKTLRELDEPSFNLNFQEKYGLFFDNITIYSSEAARKQPKKGYLLCWVMTAEKYYKYRIPGALSTWLKRCDHGQFFVRKDLNDSTIPFSTVFDGLDDSYTQLFYKSLAAFYYAYYGISSEFDWYYKVDDDTYVIVEHLRELLSRFDPSEPHYLGYQWKSYGNYHGGGPGYLLSNAAVKILVENLYLNDTICPFHIYEDVGVGQYDYQSCLEDFRCLAKLGIQSTFLPETQQRFIPVPEDFQKKVTDPEVISLHYQSVQDMKKIDTILYRIKSPRESRFYKPDN